ncbi:MAG: serine/threonine protein kinase [bacterium]|nr:serine/threonine protein kinase [bacterium]
MDMNELPERIGRYAIDAEIGRGGMGVVYRALDSRLGRVVAIKALHQQATVGTGTPDRFEREARALAALNHPNIAAIHGIERDAGRRFLVLEYVDGETLADRLATGSLAVTDALEICTQIAAGLEAAHEAGVVHRDLKPGNVKITSDGQVKVLDLGLARMDRFEQPTGPDDETWATVSGIAVTTAGTLLGTVPYMSPEQARGETVDRRSDIWSFAVILYECLTGANPFAGPTRSDTIAAILTTELDLTVLPTDTPALAVHFLRRGLQRDPRSRLRDAGDVRLLLEDCRAVVPSDPRIKTTKPEIVDKTFLIDDDICQALDRAGFDPRLIGWQMHYADNERESDILQVWIPSFGEDHAMGVWRDLLASTPFRTVVATPVGLEPDVAHRPNISMENQLAVLRRLVTAVAGRVRPDKVVVGGFS